MLDLEDVRLHRLSLTRLRIDLDLEHLAHFFCPLYISHHTICPMIQGLLPLLFCHLMFVHDVFLSSAFFSDFDATRHRGGTALDADMQHAVLVGGRRAFRINIVRQTDGAAVSAVDALVDVRRRFRIRLINK